MDIPRDLAATLAAAAAGRPVLIAGPTAGGKSALALALAERTGATVVNADALQVYGCWRVLTARPGPADLARAPHALYGHLARDADWSVGHWLRAVAPYLRARPAPVIVGGTGLYFTALTRGLAEIPPIPAPLRAEAEARLRRDGLGPLVAALDAATRARIDTANPARVLRAWEVWRATGRGLADWQAATSAPLLAPDAALRVVVRVAPDVLGARIDARFDAMMAAGALDEVRAELPHWDPARPSARAIGAPELVAHLRGAVTLPEAVAAATTATRRYAKRQRTWLRNRLGDWQAVSPEG
ncbi:tRNA (adenosine(37)-N6)-dimethylallyltransferase MiaA [Rhodobaculum claviforme]|uniref:tRNA dimethylallyltransferase n=1 Tax=Rhodobaculum claviforme TaxID=1549854 RepID=A0A934WHX1_9RHOB|nr:tRNA (adenosine(37)-N6)-dimethylallyltransferase MiaA [Rhodobaculum claviforme]MBK5927585.1 tRNA (adenosine(37)-N6)-dimethylallyltransferase MiaA [Rhodobaculum claviforme]